jgi:hypothetical protein
VAFLNLNLLNFTVLRNNKKCQPWIITKYSHAEEKIIKKKEFQGHFHSSSPQTSSIPFKSPIIAEKNTYHGMDDYENIMNRLRASFRSGKTKDVKFRRAQLENLMRMYEDNREEIINVLAADLR